MGCHALDQVSYYVVLRWLEPSTDPYTLPDIDRMTRDARGFAGTDHYLNRRIGASPAPTLTHRSLVIEELPMGSARCSSVRRPQAIQKHHGV